MRVTSTSGCFQNSQDSVTLSLRAIRAKQTLKVLKNSSESRKHKETSLVRILENGKDHMREKTIHTVLISGGMMD